MTVYVGQRHNCRHGTCAWCNRQERKLTYVVRRDDDGDWHHDDVCAECLDALAERAEEVKWDADNT